MSKKTKICITCEEETRDYYTIKTNKGDLYRCGKCYELVFLREQRDEYASYTDLLKTTQRPKS